MWNTDPAAASGREIAAMFRYTFFNSALTLGIQANSYNTFLRIRNMISIRFSPKWRWIREKSVLQYLHSEKNGSSNKVVWLTVFGWFHKIYFGQVDQILVQLTKLVCLNQPKFLLESLSWLYRIFYWLNQMFWLNISNNFERAFWGYNRHHELRQRIYEFVYMHFVCSHGLS